MHTRGHNMLIRHILAPRSSLTWPLIEAKSREFVFHSQCPAYLALCKAWRPVPLHVRALPVCSGLYICGVFEISMFYVTFKIIEIYFQQKKCHNSIIFLKKEIRFKYG